MISLLRNNKIFFTLIFALIIINTSISDNIVNNHDFSNADTDWIFYKDETTAAADSEFVIGLSGAEITISESFEFWHTMLFQKVNIEAGKHYIIGFEYKSTSATSFAVGIQHDGTDDGTWDSHFYNEIIIEHPNKTLTYWNEFTMDTEDTLTDLKFFLGKCSHGTILTLNNIYLIATSLNADFSETGYWEILMDRSSADVYLSPFDYLADTEDIDSDGSHESYVIRAYAEIMDNIIRIYYKYNFDDPALPAPSVIASNYPDRTIYNSNEDMPYTKNGSVFEMESVYFLNGTITNSLSGEYMLVSTNDRYFIYKRVGFSILAEAVNDTTFKSLFK